MLYLKDLISQVTFQTSTFACVEVEGGTNFEKLRISALGDKSFKKNLIKYAYGIKFTFCNVPAESISNK